MADWSELPRDVLTHITSSFGIPDTRRFSSVCRNWRSCAKENRNIPIPQLPWLVLADDEGSGKRRVFNMSENKHYHFDIPELRGAFIRGSSFGWLFAVSPRIDAYLVNPLSRATISLPSLPLFCCQNQNSEDCEHCEKWRPQNLIDDESLIERDPDGWPWTPCFERVQRMIVSKAILSADPTNGTDLVVMILFGEDPTKLAFYKSGDSTWTVIECGAGVYDIILFKGQFYALLPNNVLVTVDVGPEAKITDHRCCLREHSMCHSKYLVDYLGEHLFLVYRKLRRDANDRAHSTTKGFRVFNVNLKGDNSKSRPRSRPVKKLDGHAIFLGENCGIVLRASDFNGCIENSIYFSYFHSSCHKEIKKYGYDDLGVYKLEDKSFGHFYPPEIYHPLQSCPIWWVPNPNFLLD